MVALAQQLIAATKARDSTEAERESASAWLQQRLAASGSVNENMADPIGFTDSSITSGAPADVQAGRTSADTLAQPLLVHPPTLSERAVLQCTGSPPAREAALSDAAPHHAPYTTLSLDQVDELLARLRRIRLRANVMSYLFSDEDEFAKCPLREELADLLKDVRTAVDESKQILEQGQE
jgi:hypothetical protein